jgi:hypothetical protein
VPRPVFLAHGRVGVGRDEDAEAVEVLRGELLLAIDHDLAAGRVDRHSRRHLHDGEARALVHRELQAGGDARRVQVALVAGADAARVPLVQLEVCRAEDLALVEARPRDAFAHLSLPAS